MLKCNLIDHFVSFATAHCERNSSDKDGDGRDDRPQHCQRLGRETYAS